MEGFVAIRGGNTWADVRSFLQKHRRSITPWPFGIRPPFRFVTIVDLKPLGNIAAVPTVFVVEREWLAAEFVGDDTYRETGAFHGHIVR